MHFRKVNEFNEALTRRPRKRSSSSFSFFSRRVKSIPLRASWITNRALLTTLLVRKSDATAYGARRYCGNRFSAFHINDKRREGREHWFFCLCDISFNGAVCRLEKKVLNPAGRVCITIFFLNFEDYHGIYDIYFIHISETYNGNNFFIFICREATCFVINCK